MAATICVDGILLIFDRKTEIWSSEDKLLQLRANSLMEAMDESFTHIERLDFERTAAEYILKKWGKGELVHVDPYYKDDLMPPNVVE
jgi:hypothetical protein